MKKQLVSAVLCAAFLCVACVPASAAEPVERASVLAQAAATNSAQALAVSAGDKTYSIPAYEDGDTLTVIPVASADALPKLPDGVSADVTVQYQAPAMEEGEALLAPKTVFSGDESAFAAFEPHRNGTYTYTALTGGTDAEYRFTAEVNAAPRIRLSADGAALGETLAIYADYADGLTVTATTTLSYTPKFYDTADGRMALLPISYYTTPGTYSLTVTAGGTPVSYQINANKRDFVVQNLTVDEGTANSTINNDNATREWNELIEPLKYITDPQKYWEGDFLLPVQGRITTQFGAIRYTNGSKNASRHGATDIAASTGTPVPAANNGRVIFAQFIQMSGNVVVIEHGMGLKTWYFHMNEINTKVDAMVKKGDIIGKVGATGFVTGPHLHFGMSVNEVYINPMTAVDGGVG